jgi:hypothetical protein
LKTTQFLLACKKCIFNKNWLNNFYQCMNLSTICSLSLSQDGSHVALTTKNGGSSSCFSRVSPQVPPSSVSRKNAGKIEAGNQLIISVSSFVIHWKWHLNQSTLLRAVQSTCVNSTMDLFNWSLLIGNDPALLRTPLRQQMITPAGATKNSKWQPENDPWHQEMQFLFGGNVNNKTSEENVQGMWWGGAWCGGSVRGCGGSAGMSWLSRDVVAQQGCRGSVGDVMAH